VNPYGLENFTGIVRLEKLHEVLGADRAATFFDDRVMFSADPGELHTLSGHIIFNGMRGHSFRWNGADLYKRTGRDAVDCAGRENRIKLEERLGQTNLYRAEFERRERETNEVLSAPPDVACVAQDAPFVHAQFAYRAKVQSKIPILQGNCFAQISWKLVEEMEAAVAHSGLTKKPILLLGKKYGPSKGARGTRGHMATPLVKYLAQFFLIVLTDEDYTSQLCPLCHHQTEFARDSEIRSKVCKNCPVKGGNDFFFDRDYGAPSNFHFKAVFFMRSGGFYPPQYCSKKELEKRRKVVLEFLVELLVSIDNSGGNHRLRGLGDDNPQ
jgi:hypothetical protein